MHDRKLGNLLSLEGEKAYHMSVRTRRGRFRDNLKCVDLSPVLGLLFHTKPPAQFSNCTSQSHFLWVRKSFQREGTVLLNWISNSYFYDFHSYGRQLSLSKFLYYANNRCWILFAPIVPRFAQPFLSIRAVQDISSYLPPTPFWCQAGKLWVQPPAPVHSVFQCASVKQGSGHWKNSTTNEANWLEEVTLVGLCLNHIKHSLLIVYSFNVLAYSPRVCNHLLMT